MAGRPAIGHTAVLVAELSAVRDVSHRHRPRTRSRNRRRLRRESGVELERPGERFPQGSPAILARGMAVYTHGPLLRRTLRAGSLALLALVLLSAATEAQRVRIEILPPPQNGWGDDAPSVTSAGLLSGATKRDLLPSGIPARLHCRLGR